jgi:transcriptional regulator with XRE-family HTH domain
MTQERLASLINYSKAWMSNLETGQVHPYRQTVIDIEKTLKLPPKVLLDIYEMIKYEEPQPALAFDRYADAESRARIIRQYNALVVPSLLQTPEYAKALIVAARKMAKSEVIEHILSDRMARQERLIRNEPTLWLITDELSLRRPIGGREVHRAQLDALIEAAQRPNIGLQVIPLSTGAHAGLTSSFTILSFDDDPEVAYTEDCERGYFRERPDQVRVWSDTFEALRAVTLPATASFEFIQHIRVEI